MYSSGADGQLHYLYSLRHRDLRHDELRVYKGRRRDLLAASLVDLPLFERCEGHHDRHLSPYSAAHWLWALLERGKSAFGSCSLHVVSSCCWFSPGCCACCRCPGWTAAFLGIATFHMYPCASMLAYRFRVRALGFNGCCRQSYWCGVACGVVSCWPWACV